jgi:hypothetical protein
VRDGSEKKENIIYRRKRSKVSIARGRTSKTFE